jgi:hypothetical protein
MESKTRTIDTPETPEALAVVTPFVTQPWTVPNFRQNLVALIGFTIGPSSRGSSNSCELRSALFTPRCALN